jgi:hypothetical protein
MFPPAASVADDAAPLPITPPSAGSPRDDLRMTGDPYGS